MAREYRLHSRVTTGDFAEVFRGEWRDGTALGPACVKLLLARMQRDEELLALMGGPAREAGGELGQTAGRVAVARGWVEGVDGGALLARLGMREARISIPVTVEMV